MKIKICGIKYLDNMQAIQDLQPDYMGFIFYRESKRSLHETLMPSDLATVPNNIKKVGVFVNDSVRNIVDYVQWFELDAIQLHGDETVFYLIELIEKLNEMGNRPNIEIIKAFGIDAHFDFNKLNDYKQYCNFFLFDTKTPNYGGSGEKFQWSLLEQYNNALPIFLSGGISVKDLPEILNLKNINIAAVDLNSKLEIEPGRKDLVKVKEAIDLVRNFYN
jgi:phosphoribosylanthranilate isomerase